MSSPEHSNGTRSDDASDGARCEYCGLSYADAARSEGHTAPMSSATGEATAGRRRRDDHSTETHCEYCGVEYPIPPGGSGPG